MTKTTKSKKTYNFATLFKKAAAFVLALTLIFGSVAFANDNYSGESYNPELPVVECEQQIYTDTDSYIPAVYPNEEDESDQEVCSDVICEDDGEAELDYSYPDDLEIGDDSEGNFSDDIVGFFGFDGYVEITPLNAILPASGEFRLTRHMRPADAFHMIWDTPAEGEGGQINFSSQIPFFPGHFIVSAGVTDIVETGPQTLSTGIATMTDVSGTDAGNQGALVQLNFVEVRVVASNVNLNTGRDRAMYGDFDPEDYYRLPAIDNTTHQWSANPNNLTVIPGGLLLEFAASAPFRFGSGSLTANIPGPIPITPILPTNLPNIYPVDDTLAPGTHTAPVQVKYQPDGHPLDTFSVTFVIHRPVTELTIDSPRSGDGEVLIEVDAELVDPNLDDVYDDGYEYDISGQPFNTDPSTNITVTIPRPDEWTIFDYDNLPAINPPSGYTYNIIDVCDDGYYLIVELVPIPVDSIVLERDSGTGVVSGESPSSYPDPDIDQSSTLPNGDIPIKIPTPDCGHYWRVSGGGITVTPPPGFDVVCPETDDIVTHIVPCDEGYLEFYLRPRQITVTTPDPDPDALPGTTIPTNVITIRGIRDAVNSNLNATPAWSLTLGGGSSDGATHNFEIYNVSNTNNLTVITSPTIAPIVLTAFAPTVAGNTISIANPIAYADTNPLLNGAYFYVIIRDTINGARTWVRVIFYITDRLPIYIDGTGPNFSADTNHPDYVGNRPQNPDGSWPVNVSPPPGEPPFNPIDPTDWPPVTPPPGYMVVNVEHPDDGGNYLVVTLARYNTVTFDLGGGNDGTDFGPIIHQIPTGSTIAGAPASINASVPAPTRGTDSFVGWREVLANGSLGPIMSSSDVAGLTINADREFIAVWSTGGSIEGDVINDRESTSSNNVPVPGANVRIYDNNNDLIWEGTADSDGYFNTGLFPDGNFTIVIDEPGFDRSETNTAVAGNPVDYTGSDAIPLNPQGGRISGTIRNTGNGQPIPNANVRIYRVNADGSTTLAWEGPADGSGNFESAWLPSGNYRIEASHPNHSNISSRNTAVGTTNVTNQDLVWTPPSTGGPGGGGSGGGSGGGGSGGGGGGPTWWVSGPGGNPGTTNPPTTPGPDGPTHIPEAGQQDPGGNVITPGFPDTGYTVTHNPDGTTTITTTPAPGTYFDHTTIFTPPYGYEVVSSFVDTAGNLVTTIRPITPFDPTTLLTDVGTDRADQAETSDPTDPTEATNPAETTGTNNRNPQTGDEWSATGLVVTGIGLLMSLLAVCFIMKHKSKNVRKSVSFKG